MGVVSIALAVLVAFMLIRARREAPEVVAGKGGGAEEAAAPAGAGGGTGGVDAAGAGASETDGAGTAKPVVPGDGKDPKGSGGTTPGTGTIGPDGRKTGTGTTTPKETDPAKPTDPAETTEDPAKSDGTGKDGKDPKKVKGGPAGAVFGVVTGRDGFPVEGATLVAYPAAEADPEMLRATSDAEGKYELKTVPAGKCRVECNAKSTGTLSRWTTVEAEKRAELNFAAGGVRVYGLVRRGGRPLAKLPIVIEPEQGAETDSVRTTTDETGAYEAIMPKPGLLLARVEADMVRFSVPTGVGEYLHDIELLEGSISGHVYDDETRSAVPGAFVEAYRDLDPRLDFGQASSRFVKSATADKDGSFRLGDLPDGDYTLQVHAPDGGKPAFATVRNILLTAGGFAAGADAYLKAGARIEGSVLNKAGDPVAGASFTLRDAASGAPVPLPGLPALKSDAAGKFLIAGVPQGLMRLTVHAAGFAKMTLPADVTATGATLEFRLPPEGRVRAHVTDVSGAPVPKAGLVLRDAAGNPVDPSPLEFADGPGNQSDAQGYVTRGQLGAGHYTGEAAATVGRGEFEVDIVEGKTTEIEVVVHEVK